MSISFIFRWSRNMNLKVEIYSWLWMNCLSLGILVQTYHYLSKLQSLHCLNPIPHFGKRWEDVNWNYQYVIDILSILFWKTSFDVFKQLIIATLHSFCSTSFKCQVSANFPQVKVLKFFSRAWHNLWQLKLCVLLHQLCHGNFSKMKGFRDGLSYSTSQQDSL